MYTILIRAVILYIVMIVAMRSMGKRQLGQFQPFEFAMALMIADILATPMSEVSTPLLHGVLPVTAMISIHSLITLLCLKSDKARQIISGKPSVLIYKSVIQADELDRLCLSLSDLQEGIRESGILNPNDVEYAVMESDGTITAFPRASKRPANSEEANIATQDEEMPLALIMDGSIQKHNLKSAGFSENELLESLKRHKVKSSDILLAVVSSAQEIVVSTKNGEKQTVKMIKDSNDI